jgi:hypothetical protein
MASEVDIANLALAHLGDNATIASLYPPEGSAQAEHCARFYPIARDTLLEMHAWDFATKRVNLALLDISMPEWDYVYARPNDAVQIISILPANANDDYSTRYAPADNLGYTANNVPIGYAGMYVPQPFQTETYSDGTQIILADQVNAVCRYVASVSDTTKFSALFTTTLSWHLASMIAGPVIKGDVGAAEAKRCAQMASVYLGEARKSDSSQRQIKPNHIVNWVAGR